FDRPLRVGHDNTRTREIVATLPETSIGDSFGLELNKSVGVAADPSVTWVVESVQTGSKASYIGLVPAAVTIDGAFGDWSSRVPILDMLGDAYSNRTLDRTSGDVDIDTVKLASTTDTASFYMSVNGTVLGGSSVPTSMVRFVTPGPPAVNVTNITVPMYGADFAFVFIDIDRNQRTGFYVGGSEASIAVVGKGNEILSSRLLAYEDGKWIDIGKAEAAIDLYQLEVSAPYSAIGLVSGQNYPITFLAQDWSGRMDDIAVALPARITAGTSAYGGILINELYNKDQGKPTDWIELYNTGTVPINIGGWELWVNGVLVYTFPSVTINPGEFYVARNLDFGRGTNFMLIDSSGSTVDQCVAPGWNERSWGRTGSPPYDSWTTMTPTPGSINQGQVPIPEFQDAAVPLAIVPIMLFAIRRARAAGRGAKE
ncbi:MAG: lamin tail domain-containing protein, partial [Thermoplasmata archaeon]